MIGKGGVWSCEYCGGLYSEVQMTKRGIENIPRHPCGGSGLEGGKPSVGGQVLEKNGH